MPTTEFFTDSFSASEEEVRQVLDRTCDLLKVDARLIDLEFFDEKQAFENQTTALGLYLQEGDRYRVWIENKELENPIGMVATMAHELCHVHLLGHGRVSEEEDDQEPLTDLLTVFLGLGVITANGAFHDSNWHAGGWEGWQVGRRGYLTMAMYGYALALFANLRGERKPSWAKHLRADVRHAFEKTCRFYEQHPWQGVGRLRQTTARPTLTRTEELPEVEKEAAEHRTEFEEGECDYCGEPLTENDLVEGICADCWTSVEENDQALAEDRENEQLMIRRRNAFLKWTGILVGAVILVMILLDSLGLLES